MTRPNFTVSLPSPVRIRSDTAPNAGWTLCPDHEFCSEVITGVSRRKPKGWVPPTGYSLLRRKYTRAYGLASKGVTSTNWNKIEGACGNNSRVNSLNDFDACVSESTANLPLDSGPALIAARGKIKNKKVDLGVAFAERKATSRMLGDTATRMARAVRSLRHGEFRNAARQLGVRGDPGKPKGSNWTNHWLQLQYGWKPLLSDVYGSASALSKREASDWRVTAKASRRDEESYSVYLPPIGVTYPTANFDAHSGVATRRRGVFVRIDAVPDNDLKMSLASLGVTNPLLVAWELVPYSFVVDWVLPIGGWLDSLDAMLGYTKAYTSVTHFNETEWTDVGLSKVWSNVAFIKNDWTASKRVLRINRAASSGVPLAPFPSIKDPRSLGHMANGLSLLAQAFGRR